jgi:hypothetical protein
MVNADGQIQFTITPVAPLPAVEVRMRRFGERWVAQATGAGSPNVGVATTPRAALAAALAPLGEGATRLLLADLSLLEPSVQILETERAAAS